MASTLEKLKAVSTNFDHEKFNNVLSGVQSLIISIAVIIGGFWTFFTFSYLGASEKAKAELFRQSVIGVEIEGRQETINGDEGLYIAAVVKLTNKGNRNTQLDYRGRALGAYKVAFNEDGTSKYNQIIMQPILFPTPFEGVLLRAGSTQQLPFLVRVPERGIYLLDFSASVDRHERQIMAESGDDEYSPVVDKEDPKKPAWWGATFVQVK